MDGLSNYDEVYIHFTDPWKADTDGDGLTDYEETFIFHTNPLAQKTNPNQERTDFFMVGLDQDADGDGLPDHVEDWYNRRGFGLNKNDPNDAAGDLDGDGISNLDAWLAGWDLTANLHRYDSDGDGITDAVEDWWNMNHPGIFNKFWFDDAVQDYDGDGLLNFEEILLGLDPGNPMSDGVTPDLQRAIQITGHSWSMPLLPGDADADGMSDLWEHRHHFNLRSPADAALDPDGDGLPNLMEFQTWRNPWLRDYSPPGGVPDDLDLDENDETTLPASANQPWQAQASSSLPHGSTRSYNVVDGTLSLDAPGMMPRVQTKKFRRVRGDDDAASHLQGGTWHNRQEHQAVVEAEGGEPPEGCIPQGGENASIGDTCSCQHGTAERFERRGGDAGAEWYYQGTPVSQLPEGHHGRDVPWSEEERNEGGWHEEPIPATAFWQAINYCPYESQPSFTESAYMRIVLLSNLPQNAEPVTRHCMVETSYYRKRTENDPATPDLILINSDLRTESMTIQPGSRHSNPAGDVAGSLTKVKVTYIPDSSPPKPPPLSLSDAAGTRYRKVGLNGYPMPDAKPQVQSENGENPEETHLDPFSCQIRHSVTDVYVEAPGALLPLTVRRDLTPESWNDRSGLRGDERPWQPFGPGWSTNLCAYVKFTNYRQAEVMDEQGASHTYFLDGGDPLTGAGAQWLHDRQEHRDVKTRMNQFTANVVTHSTEIGIMPVSPPQFSNIKLVKKFGTTCAYQMVLASNLHQILASDRMTPADDASIHTYARLSNVTDRHGNRLVYEYPDSSSLIPKRIYDPDRPGHQILISQQMGRVTTIQDPSGRQIHYSYVPTNASNHSTVSMQAPVSVLEEVHGAPPGTGVFPDALNRLHHTTLLASVTQSGASVGYRYSLHPDCEPPSDEDDPGTMHLHVALSQITDERGNAWNFHHSFNRYIYSWTGEHVKRQFGLPMLLTHVMQPDGTHTQLHTTRTVNPAGGVFPTTSFTTTVTAHAPAPLIPGLPAEPVRRFTYEFKDPVFLTPTGYLHATASPTNVTYAYRQMDITSLQVQEGNVVVSGTESFHFDPDASMALSKTVDRSGGVTEFVYDSSGYDDPIKERRQVSENSWLEKSFVYDSDTRILTKTTDARAIVTQHTLTTRTLNGRTAKGLRASEKITGPAGTPGGSLTTWAYEHPVFAGFITSQTVDFPTARNGVDTPTAADVPAVVTTFSTAAKDSVTGWWRRVTETRQIGGQSASTLTVSDFNGRKRSVTDPRGQTTLFDYDERGRLTRVTHPDQTFRFLDYDAHGNLILEMDENGTRTLHAYDVLNRRISTTVDLNRNGIPDARYTQVAHDASGFPVYNGDIVTEVLHYNSLNLPVLERDARGILTLHEYDFIGRKIRTTVNPGGTVNERAVTSLEYQVAGINGGKEAGGSVFDSSSFKPVRVTDPRGQQTSFTYNPLHQLIREQRPDGNVIHRTYNQNGQSASVTTAAPSAWTPPFLTVEGHQQINHTTAASSGVFVTRTLYDALGLPRQVTLPDGTLSTSLHTAQGKPWKQVDETGAETLTHYDTAGLPVRLTQDIVPAATLLSTSSISTSNARPVTFTSYDLAGNPVKITDPLGNVTRIRYDARNRPWKVIQPRMVHPDLADAPENTPGKYISPTVVTEYDAAGRVIKVTNPLGHTTRSFYDAAGRLVRVFDPLDNATAHTHDPAGNVLTSTDPLGRTTTNTYDALGRHRASTDPSGIATSFTYDAGGNRTALTDGLGRTTSFLYDVLGRLTRQTHPNGDATIHTWVLDRKTSETSPDNRVTTFTYDTRGRLTNQVTTTSGIGSGALESRRSYDAAGRLSKVVDLAPSRALTTPGVACRYQHDKLGRLTAEASYATNTDTTGLTHLHHYDRAGNRVRSELACGMGAARRVLTTTLDSHHRPLILHDDNQTPATPADDRLTRWRYDPAGRAIRLTLPNGQTQVNHHDAAGRLVLRELHRPPPAGQAISGSTLLASFTWQHDAAGSVTAQTEHWFASGTQPARTRSTTMEYDASSRLHIERVQDGGTALVTTTYAYDAANNRTGKTVALSSSGSAPSGVETGHWTYIYNNANQLTRWTKHAGASAGVGVGPLLTGASFTYDKSGNRTSRVQDGTTAAAARTTTYTWDTWNRLQKVVVPVTATAKRTWTYTYDHRMRRTSIHQTGSGLKTHHTAVVFSGGLSVAEFTRSSNAALSATTLPAVRYLRGPDMGGGVGGLLGTLRHPVNTSEIPVAPTAANPVRERYNLSNGRGDIVAQSDQSATLTWTASYEAYGKRTRETGANADRQRANTKDEDPTGLLNEGFRYRDIETGVWLSRDPAGFVDGPNLYAYVKQNPWTHFDPLGLFIPHPTALANNWIRDHTGVDVLGTVNSVSQWMHEHPRTMGGVKAVGGAAETVVGGAAILAPEPTMVTKVVGTAAVAHGADTFQAGVHQMFSGKPERTLTSQGVEKIATIAGASNPVAVGEWTDAGLGMGLSLGSGFLSNTAKAPNIVASARLTAQESGTVLGQAKGWWLKGAEGDAAWSRLSASDKFYFEIGQKTLSDEAFKAISHITDPVARGKAMVEQMGVVKATMTVNPKAMNPGAAGTLSTGPTPGARAAIRTGGAGAGAAGQAANAAEPTDEDDE